MERLNYVFSTTIIVLLQQASCLILYKTLLTIRAYKNWLLSSIESIVYFNLATFAAITWYSFDSSQNGFQTFQIIISYISIGGTLILFIFVLIFHAYRYGSAKFYSWCQTTKFVREMQHLFEHDERRQYIAQSDRDVYRLFEAIDNPSPDRQDVSNPILRQVQATQMPAVAEGGRGPVFSVLSMSDCEELPPAVEEEYVHVSEQMQHRPTSNANNYNLNKASTLPGHRSSLMAEYDFTRDLLIRPRSLSHGSSRENSKPLLGGDQ